MSNKIKLTSEELGLMSLFQSISGATARDCLIDSKNERVMFIINKGEMGLAIGKGGSSIKNIEKLVGKPVELIEHSSDPKEFIRNSLNSKFVADVRITNKLDGTKMAVVVVDERRKGVVVGRNGKNAEKARLLARRYFEIDNIHIVTQQ